MRNRGEIFTDNSSGRFCIKMMEIRWSGLYYVVKIIRPPKDGEPTVANLDNAVNDREFLIKKSVYKKLKKKRRNKSSKKTWIRKTLKN